MCLQFLKHKCSKSILLKMNTYIPLLYQLDKTTFPMMNNTTSLAKKNSGQDDGHNGIPKKTFHETNSVLRGKSGNFVFNKFDEMF